MKRIDEDGVNALVKTTSPVNCFPDFVRYIVQRLKVLCPTMGKKRIAQTLARAGLTLGVSTVGRMLRESPGKQPQPARSTVSEAPVQKGERSPVQAKAPNHVWQVDLTLVPTAAGFWMPWLPFAIAQCWPFSWWVACVVDHYSRRVMGFAVFSKEPKSVDVLTFLGRLARRHGAPKYLISDKGRQFDCTGYRAWCERKGIRPRYASTGSLRATAIVERFFLSLKDEWLRRIFVPLSREAMRRELASYLSWFAEHRTHQGLDGRTPNDVYAELPACAAASKEQQKPQTIPCCELVVRFHEERRQLPIVELRRAA
jgi:transposase InsO family protein